MLIIAHLLNRGCEMLFTVSNGNYAIDVVLANQRAGGLSKYVDHELLVTIADPRGGEVDTCIIC